MSFNMTFIRDIASSTDVTANLVNGVKKDKLGDLSVDHNSLQLKVQSKLSFGFEEQFHEIFKHVEFVKCLFRRRVYIFTPILSFWKR